jgi:hypothetical protein
MLAEAFSIYRRHFGALVLTAALALLPANLLMAGAVVFGLAGLGAGGVAETQTRAQQVQEQTRDRQEDQQPRALQEQPGDLPQKHPPAQADQAVRAREALRAAAPHHETTVNAEPLRRALPIAYAVLVVAAVLLAGLFFAHAALVPLVIELRAGRPTGPARAWAEVAPRLGALLRTALLGAPLVALGFLFLVVPGIALAVGFGFAVPAAMTEGVSGRAALHRSWTLMRGHWACALGMWTLILIFTLLASGAAMLVHAGPWRSVVSGAVRLLTYPLPLAGLILLYVRAREEEGAPVLPSQYIRRISAPG